MGFSPGSGLSGNGLLLWLGFPCVVWDPCPSPPSHPAFPKGPRKVWAGMVLGQGSLHPVCPLGLSPGSCTHRIGRNCKESPIFTQFAPEVLKSTMGCLVIVPLQAQGHEELQSHRASSGPAEPAQSSETPRPNLTFHCRFPVPSQHESCHEWGRTLPGAPHPSVLLLGCPSSVAPPGRCRGSREPFPGPWGLPPPLPQPHSQELITLLKGFQHFLSQTLLSRNLATPTPLSDRGRTRLRRCSFDFCRECYWQLKSAAK